MVPDLQTWSHSVCAVELLELNLNYENSTYELAGNRKLILLVTHDGVSVCMYVCM